VASFPEFHLSTLGALQLVGPTGDVLAGRRKELALLAYLARCAPRAVSREELATLLWGERDESKARQSLRHALLQLRRLLADAVDVTNEGVRVLDDRLEIDASALEADVTAGRYADAIERWHGDFLAGAEDSGDESFRAWLEREREALRRTVLVAFSRVVAAARDDNDLTREVAVARRWARHFPLDSQANARLIEALLRDGDIEAARATYAAHVAHLRSELDVEPGDELRRLGDDLAQMQHHGDAGRPGSAALLTPDIVGRDAILASLLELWSRIRESPAVVVIEGDEGIGKTRVCAELVRRIARSDRPGLVLHGRAVPGDADTSWSTFRRLLAPLTRLPAVQDMPNRALVELSAILPSLRQRFPQLAEPSGVEGRAESALRDVLRALGGQIDMLVIVDDVAFADAASRDLLLSLMRELPPATLLVLTGRADQLAATALPAALGSTPAARLIKLPAWSRDDLARAIDSMVEVSRADRDVLARRIAGESGGNPFYALELVAAMADSGALTLGASGRWQIDPAFASRAMPLPPSLRAAVKTRLSQLSEPARNLISALATQDSPLDDVRARHIAGMPPDVLEAALDELLSRRFLRAAGDGPGAYEFSNDLLRRIAAERATGVAREAPHESVEPTSTATGSTSRASYGRWRRVAAAVGVMIVAGILWNVLTQSRSGPSSETGPAAPRVAVLDLSLVAPDTSEAYLAAGLSEEINSSLSRFGRIRLKSRGAVRAARGSTMDDPVALGRRLQVDYLVEGSLQRMGDRLKVAVRLTKTDDGFQLWGHDFESGLAELPDLHQRIATEVAARIGGRLSPSEVSAIRRPLTQDARAFEHYLRGNAFLGRRTPLMVEQAIDQFQLALARDSSFTAAQARIAYGYSLFLDWGWRYRAIPPDQLLRDGLAMTQAVLAKDSASTDAWMSRAYLLVLQDPVAMSGALPAFERAIALDPSNVEAHYQYGQSLMALGRWNEARLAYRRAIALEPDRAQTYISLGSIERKEGNADLARRLYDTALVVDPGAAYARSARAALRLAEGDVAGALEDAETAVRTTQGYAVPPRSMLAAALARSGRLDAANREIAVATAAMADLKVPGPTDARWLGSALLAAGRIDEALTLLERARPRGAWLWFYCTATDFDPVRANPRFVTVMNDAKPPRGSLDAR
jgi:DNA-binding SARP family transcriptional activator/TolB-like protein